MSHLSNLKTLVVDDMAFMRKVVKQGVLQAGVQTPPLEATTGAEALKLLEQAAADGKPVEFVVSDWTMPQMTGIELLGKVRAHPAYKNVAFLLVTAEAEIKNVKDALAAGVDGYVVKPFEVPMFLQKFMQVYNKRFKT
jgi:two-component system chemotaxis response regulator CheY